MKLPKPVNVTVYLESEGIDVETISNVIEVEYDEFFVTFQSETEVKVFATKKVIKVLGVENTN